MQLVKVALHNGPQPGPFTYVVQCMYIVCLLGKTYSEGFSHMLTSSLRHLKSVESVQKDFLEALESALEIRPEQPSTERSLLILLSYVQIMCCATFDICFDYGNINYQQLMEKNQNYLPSVSQMHGKEMEMSRRLGSDISSNDMEWALYMNT